LILALPQRHITFCFHKKSFSVTAFKLTWRNRDAIRSRIELSGRLQCRSSTGFNSFLIVRIATSVFLSAGKTRP
jgi:hypothetical protein